MLGYASHIAQQRHQPRQSLLSILALALLLATETVYASASAGEPIRIALKALSGSHVNPSRRSLHLARRMQARGLSTSNISLADYYNGTDLQ
jgi:hypothetical protein